MRYLSVVIPNKNGEELLRRFLPENIIHIEKEAKALDLALEFIVVDGRSTDKSESVVAQLKLSNFRFINFNGTAGYGTQLNHGISVSRGDWVLVLTTDVAVSENFLSPLINTMSKDKNIFSVSPRIIRPLEGGAVESLTRGRFRRHEIEVIRRTNIEELELERNVLWPCGAVFLVRRNLFSQLGGFSDEFLPGYSEDVDIGLRAWKNGLCCRYNPDSIANHWHNSTFKKSGAKSVEFLLVRNHILLNLKHLPFQEKLFFVLKRFIRAIRHRNITELSGVVSGSKRYWTYRRFLSGESMTLSELKQIMDRVT